ncbi:SGNH/GDSL hydrolase family protein [Clostridium akagii]|uniref:SGNH/GDSL hydrolase family protein n=1 Tax=Clostridium akagii TaxID=91623 RepID=UPI00047ADEDE|nr:SGNH/GDSL hydrolase family protein [Clostridium akagii]
MIKKLMLRIITIVGIIVIITAIIGIITSIYITTRPMDKTAVKDKTTKETIKPTGKPKNNVYNILSMGDSIANGTGDETGRGFADYYADSYKKDTKQTVNVNNIAVNGDVSDGLSQIVRNKETSPIIQSSNLIFISIGGNEIKQFATSDDISSLAGIKTVENHYLSNLGNVLKKIRSENSKCMIVFIGLYNPFGDDITQDKLELLDDWNYETQKLVSDDSNAVYIPTYDLFKYNMKKYLTIDNFHPNSEGYRAIARRIGETLKNK